MVPENQRYTTAHHTQTKPSPLNTCIRAKEAREDYFDEEAHSATCAKMNTLPAIDSLDGETQDLSHYQICYDTTSPDTSFAASNDDEFVQTISNYEAEPKADDPVYSAVQHNQDSDDYNSRSKIKQPKTLRPLAPARDALPGRWTIRNSPPMAGLSPYQPFPTNDKMNWMPGSYQFPDHQLGADLPSAIHHSYNMAQSQGSYTIPYSEGFTSPVMSVTAPMNNVVVIPNYPVPHQDMGRCDSASPGPHDGINLVPQHIFSSQVMYTSHNTTYGTQDDGSADHRPMLLSCGAPVKSASIPVVAQDTFFTDHMPYSSSVPSHLSDEIMMMQSQVPIIRGRITNADRAKRRRETHNAIERRRRDQINERIAELSTLIPQCQEVIMQTTSLSSTGAAIASAISDGPETQDASILSSMNKGEQNRELPTPDCGPECVLTTTTIVPTVNILSASGASGPLACVCLQHSRPAILPQPGSDAQSSLIRLNKTFILEKSVEYIRQLQEAVKRQAILLRRTSGIIPRAALEDLGRDLMEDNSSGMNMPNVCSQSPNQGPDDQDIF